MASKKVEGFSENSRGDVAVIGFRNAKGQVEIDLVDYHWACLLGGKPMPFIPMEDGTQVLATEVEGYLGVDVSPDGNKAERELKEEWAAKVEKFSLEIAEREEEDDEDGEDDEDDDTDGDDDEDNEEPVRVRPRRR